MTVGLAPRAAALAAIRAVDHGAWSTQAVPDAIADLSDQRDRALAAHLAHGTIRWRASLDWALDRVLQRDLVHVEAVIVPILRLGAFQLRHSRVPARAAVDTSVELARQAVPSRRAKGATGFVNGVLRGLDRARDDIAEAMAARPPVERIALATGHPAWLVQERLDAGIDEQAVEALMEADNDPPGVTLRAVQDRQQVLAALAAAGVEAAPTERAALGIRVPGSDPRRLDVVADGLAVPQDEASMLVVEAAVAEAGDRVVDLCAAPGGKSTDLATRVGPQGEVVAVELHEHRAALVRESAARVGVTLDVRVGDARTLALPDEVDVVLVDAPCTGLGVGRRRPEVRWRRSPADVDELADLQVQLVERGLQLLRPGGHLTYSVCTWTTAETTGVVTRVEAAAARQLDRVGMRQLQPDEHDTDGMFHVTWQVDG